MLRAIREICVEKELSDQQTPAVLSYSLQEASDSSDNNKYESVEHKGGDYVDKKARTIRQALARRVGGLFRPLCHNPDAISHSGVHSLQEHQ